MHRSFSLIPATWSALLALILWGTWLPASRAEEKKGEPADIAGDWDSNWGLATLQTKPIKGKTLVSVTGSYSTAPDQKGFIKSGSFDPATGVFEFNFEEPFRGPKAHGKAKMTLAADGNHFKGRYDQVGEHGDWNMTRVRGKDFDSGMGFLFADADKRKDAPGAAVLAIDHGKVVFERCYGLANLKDKKPITPRTTFELASVTKQFTGAAILRLYEQGKLDLDDDVRKYLPELPEYNPKNPIRILNLARHTSGLRECMDFPDVKGKDPAYLSNEDYVGEFARQRKEFPLYFPTGTNSRYTNTNYLLLALIVERVSKQSFGAFMKSEFFDPLGMKSATVYENPRVKPKEPALGYSKDKGAFEEAWGPPPFRHETLLTVGDGGLWASLNDMARWDEGWRKGKVLKPKTIKEALVPSKFGKDQTNDYAFGWGVTMKNGKLAGQSHNGGWGGFATYIERNIADDRTLVILNNGGNLDNDEVISLWRRTPPKGQQP
jgi:CubicO group peptidase (beta-lactamase class C family)